MIDTSSIFNCHQKASVNLRGGKKSATFLLKSVLIALVLLAYFVKNVAPHEVTDLKPRFTPRSSLIDESPSANQRKNCSPPAIHEFPSDGFSREERRQGWILLHILIACYSFWSLAIICDDYFVPAISEICKNLHWKKDVVGATIMAAASSSPELFMNFIATFVTKNDIGVGSVVGSALFNILLVPAFCGLFVHRRVILDWWPLTRDSLMYCVSIVGLIATVYDGKVMWYEAAGLVFTYGIYLLVMCYNDTLTLKAKRVLAQWRGGNGVAQGYREVFELTPLLVKSVELGSGILEVDEVTNPWDRRDGSYLMFLARWPLTFLFWLTIPDCRRRPSWKYLTFFVSVIWIAAISYVVAFVITVLGDTLDIPDSVMGLTVLAAGMSVPEAAASIIVTRQGQGSMGLSNIIGSNIFDILLCLGLPWLVKSCLLPSAAGSAAKWIAINSGGFTYSTVFLLTSLFGLYAGCSLNRFVLDWRIGLACCLMYVGFLAVALPIGLNVFSGVNLPICQH